MNNFLNSPNERLKHVRNLLEKSQLEFSKDLSVRQSYYSEIETGKRDVGKKIAEKLREKYSISSDWLYSGNGDIYITKSGSESPHNLVPTLSPNGKPPKNLDPYFYLKSLSDDDLDWHLSIEIELLREIHTALENVLKIGNSFKLSESYKSKFDMKYWKPYEEYRKGMEETFEETHNHIKNKRNLKALKIVDLYQSDRQHLIEGMSTLLGHLARLAEMNQLNKKDRANAD